MSISIESESLCRYAYVNYNLYGNTIGLSTEEYCAICSRWSDLIGGWQRAAEADSTQYEIDEEEFNNFREKGWSDSENRTGYDGDTSGAKAGTVLGARGALGSGVAGVYNGVKAGVALGKGIGKGVAKGIGKLIGKTTANAAGNITKKTALAMVEQAGENAANAAKAVEGSTEAAVQAAREGAEQATASNIEQSLESQKDVFGHAAVWGGAGLACATALASWNANKNQEAVDAAVEMQQAMMEADGLLTSDQQEMEDMTRAIQETEDLAVETQESAQEELDTIEGEKLIDLARYEQLKAKDKNGTITDEEKRELDDLAATIKKYDTEDKTAIVGETGETIEGLNADIATYQDGFDSIAENFATITGQIDYASSFDEDSRTLCQVDAFAQGVNGLGAVGTGAQGVKLMADDIRKASAAFALPAGTGTALGIMYTAFAVADGVAIGAAGTGALFSGKSMARENEHAKLIGQEIDARAQTTELQASVNEVYDENLDFYAGSVEIIGETGILEVGDTSSVEGSSGRQTKKEEEDKNPPLFG